MLDQIQEKFEKSADADAFNAASDFPKYMANIYVPLVQEYYLQTLFTLFPEITADKWRLIFKKIATENMGSWRIPNRINSISKRSSKTVLGLIVEHCRQLYYDIDSIRTEHEDLDYKKFDDRLYCQHEAFRAMLRENPPE